MSNEIFIRYVFYCKIYKSVNGRSQSACIPSTSTVSLFYLKSIHSCVVLDADCFITCYIHTLPIRSTYSVWHTHVANLFRPFGSFSSCSYSRYNLQFQCMEKLKSHSNSSISTQIYRSCFLGSNFSHLLFEIRSKSNRTGEIFQYFGRKLAGTITI